MAYSHPIPDAPAPLSMLPRATTITLEDLLYLVQPGNPIGQRSKSLTLQELAAFLANTNLQEITLAGTNGKTLVLNGEGSVFTKPPTAGTLDRLTITEDSDGITIAVTGPTVNRTVKMSQTEISISRTQGGLETKITMDGSGITLSDQERVGPDIVETSSKLTHESLESLLLKIKDGGDGNYDWDITVDNDQSSTTYGGVIFGPHNNPLDASGVALHIPGLHVWKQAAFEKDVDINADVTVEKSLKLDGTLPVLENKKGSTNVNSLYFQSAATPDSNSTLQYCSALSISGGQYTLPNHGSAASNLGHLKIIANDTSSSVQVYFRNSLSVTLAPGQAAQFLWGGGDYGWFRF